MTMRRPVLLLDVDGVLNVLSRNRADLKKREVRLSWRPGRFISFYPTKLTLPFMKMAWRLFDVRWLTAWGKGANMIAEWARLPAKPAIRDSGLPDWKATGARKALASRKGPVAWIEDGLSDEAHALVRERGWIYFETDPFVGVTQAHMRSLEGLVERKRVVS